MKKILIIGPFPEPTTGVSLANRVFYENLPKENFKVDVINTSYTRFDESLGSFSFHKILFYLKMNFSIFKVFNNDTIYLTPGQTFFGVVKYALFILLAKLLKKEIIVHVHGNYLGKEYETLKGLKKKIFKKLLRCSSKGIVLSESLKDNMTRFLPENQIFSVYNFVEDYLFVDSSLIKEKLENKTPRIIFLSNLMDEKGILYLLQALLDLEREGFEYEAKIAGNIDPKNKARIENYFKQLKKTEYCGIVSGNDKKSLLLWGNIFILPTYYSMEGQPISILEGMATANLILTTEHSGIPDIFSDRINGFYVDKKSSESIKNKIKYSSLSFKEANEMRYTNYCTAKDNYRVGSFIDSIIEVIKA
ncbi:MAG: glycosyltransferase family 4 protein [Mangrovimonas sp.]|nr:glycosyltransferase family 4 protein [Mangrovimonas sp.]HRV54342.1 glycosyltransferase family 4 protein [Mangrovimonas sp.]